jgi:hypothetical protein
MATAVPQHCWGTAVAMGLCALLLFWPLASLAGRPQVVEWSGDTPADPMPSSTVSPAGRDPGQTDITGPSAEGPDSPVDFTIHSFDCPDCVDGQWMTIMNVKGTPTNNSMMEFSCSGLKVKQAAFYLLLPVLPKDDPKRRTHVQIFVSGSDQADWIPLELYSTVSTVWLDQGDVIIFKTTTRDMKFVPGTMIKVHAV